MALLPFDDRDGWIWLDGALVPWRDARLHVLSHGLHYASAVFEGERAYRGTIFRLRDHTRRLIASAGTLGFEIPWTEDDIAAVSQQVVQANGLQDAYVRPIAWRGPEQLAVSPVGTSTRLSIAAWAWPNYFGRDRMEGILVAESTWRRPAPDTAPTQAKAASLYAIGSLSKLQAEQQGCSDALMLDWRGKVADTSGANIFLVIDGALHTPIADHFLDGLTRQTVIRLARAQQIKVVERQIDPSELPDATEVFLTGTGVEVTAVRQIGSKHYAPGRITEALMTSYDTLVLQSPEDVAKLVA